MTKTVLLVEDNEQLNTLNRRALEMAGYEVLTARAIAQARKGVENPEVDLDVILLDISLPDGSGVDFCREIRGETTAHIIFLTALQDDKTMLTGLGVGGDDYITKPYKLEEMLARVNAAIRRRDMIAGNTAQTVAREGLVLASEWEGGGFHAILNGKDLNLTVKEFAVLSFLVKNEGKTFSSEALYERVWNRPMMSDDHSVKNLIYRLRKKLESDDTPHRIVSSRNEGYSFEC